MANRCFVHEDARRVPRVAPWSPSSPSRSYFNGGPPNLPQHLMPISLHIQSAAYSAYTSLPQVPKCGFQLESSLKCQMGCLQLHLNASECGLKSIRKEESDHISLKGERISMVELWNSAVEEEVPYLTGKMESEYTEGIDIRIQDKEFGLSWCPSISLAKFGQEHLLFSSNPKTDPEKLNSYSPLRNAYKKLCDNACTREPNGILNSEQELSKAQLLEALLRSQTRARKAEKAAEKACKEKDRIVNLLFTQTSHLFAHKLWFKLLQSEAPQFYHQSQGSHDSIRRRKGERRKVESSGCGRSLAMGLSMAVVGLFFGWTAGFLLSSS